MSNTKLIGISAIIIIALAGIPHLLHSFSNDENDVNIDHSIEEPSEEINKFEMSSAAYNFLGKWKVDYDSEDFKGSIVYKIKNENGTLNAYSTRFIDDYGQSVNDNTLVLKLNRISDSEVEGIYLMQFDGDNYNVTCKVKWLTETQFKLSYDYHGYSDTEIWNKIK